MSYDAYTHMIDAADPPRATCLIHHLARMDRDVVVGPGTAVWAFATIHEGVRLGADCGVGEHAYIGRNTVIGTRTRIGQGAHITDHMTVGDDVFIGPQVVFSNDRHPIANNPGFDLEAPIVEDHVSIGVNATILPGVRLGRGCVVGAGAVVTKDVPPGRTVIGNPAHLMNQTVSG